MVSAILARHGYEPAVARDGLAGIEMIKKGPKYDLVLLDFVMPRMNGYQFCRELRSNPAHRALPVVLMSAKGDKIRGQFVQQTGAVDAITKPFDARALVAVIEGALVEDGRGARAPRPRGREDARRGHDRREPAARAARQAAAAQRPAVDVAQRVAQAITPAMMGLSPARARERGRHHGAPWRGRSPAT